MSTIQTAATVIPFPESRTFRALQEALGHKRRAQRLYLSAARRLEEDGLQVIAHVFRFTAAQEKEHAAILQGLLTAHGGDAPPAEDVPPAEDAPPAEAAPPLAATPLELLHAAVSAEHSAWDERSPADLHVAGAEGYPRIAATLRRIAETDQQHARRFVQYMEALAEGRLFRNSQRVSWVCLACGQLHTGCEAPAHCPGCSGGQGHFIRTSYYPFSVEA